MTTPITKINEPTQTLRNVNPIPITPKMIPKTTEDLEDVLFENSLLMKIPPLVEGYAVLGFK